MSTVGRCISTMWCWIERSGIYIYMLSCWSKFGSSVLLLLLCPLFPSCHCVPVLLVTRAPPISNLFSHCVTSAQSYDLALADSFGFVCLCLFSLSCTKPFCRLMRVLKPIFVSKLFAWIPATGLCPSFVIKYDLFRWKKYHYEPSLFSETSIISSVINTRWKRINLNQLLHCVCVRKNKIT